MRRSRSTSAASALAVVAWVAVFLAAGPALGQAAPDEPPLGEAPTDALATDDETPAGGAADASDPTAEADAAEPKPSGAKPPATGANDLDTTISVFEYIETISVESGPQKMTVVSSQVVIVRRKGDVVSVELKPSAESGRGLTEDADPARGSIELRNGGAAANRNWDLRPAVVEFDFARTGDREAVSVDGLHPNALRECSTILGQARDTNVFGGEGESVYTLPLSVAGKPYRLKARQTNGPMWVDWVLTEDGIISVGSEQVSLPLTFTIESTRPPKTRMTLTALAKMDYSTSRLGPDSPATLKTVLTFKGRGDTGLTYTRDSSLRPLRVAPNVYPSEAKVSSEARKILAGGGFAGDAGAWSRSVTLALFGAQGLVGIRDTGLAMWLAQSSIDTLASRDVARALGKDAKVSVAEVSKLSPPISAPPDLLSDDVAGRSRYRVTAGLGQHTLAGTSVGALSFGQSHATSIFGGISVMKRSSRSFYYGWGGKGVVVQSMESAERYWYAVGLLGKLEFELNRFRLGLSAGPGVIYYLFQSPSGSVGADMLGLLIEADVELKLGSTFGLFFGLDSSNDMDALSTSSTMLGFRIYARDGLAIQIASSFVYLSDESGSIGVVEQEDLGDGSYSVGVMARW